MFVFKTYIIFNNPRKIVNMCKISLRLNFNEEIKIRGTSHLAQLETTDVIETTSGRLREF